MAAGDLIIAVNQYEYNGWLFGAGTKFQPDKFSGLIDAPPIRSKDIPREDAWGSYPGRDVYSARVLTFNINMDSDPANVWADGRAVRNALLLQDVSQSFVINLPDGLGKRYCLMRPRKSDWDLEYKTHLGWGVGSVMLEGADPRWYNLVEASPSVNAGIGVTAVNLDVTNVGNTDSAPVIEITGPWTNPRVANPQDGNRQLRLNAVVPAGQVLSIDMKTGVILLNGAVAPSGTLRDDNQWWKLKPGVNHLTANRDDSAALGTFKVRYRDAWISL